MNVGEIQQLGQSSVMHPRGGVVMAGSRLCEELDWSCEWLHSTVMYQRPLKFIFSSPPSSRTEATGSSDGENWLVQDDVTHLSPVYVTYTNYIIACFFSLYNEPLQPRSMPDHTNPFFAIICNARSPQMDVKM